jgi:hypothetical protein
VLCWGLVEIWLVFTKTTVSVLPVGRKLAGCNLKKIKNQNNKIKN